MKRNILVKTMPTSKINKTTCVAIDDFGKGICRIEGKTYFVENFLPGEEAEVETVFEYGKVKYVKLKKRLSKSKHRLVPPCRYYDSCGGCSLQHLDYTTQLGYKRQRVKDCLHKFGGIDVEVERTLGLDDPWYFRNKIQTPVGGRRGDLFSGFYKEKTHKLVPIENCLIESKMATEVRKKIIKILNKYDIESYKEDFGTGFMRHILIKVSEYYNEVMVVLVTAKDEFYGGKNLAREIVEADGRVKAVVQNINTKKTNVILGEKSRVLYGTGKIKKRLCDLDFLVSDQSFYQTNEKQTETLYNCALDLASITKEDRVLDAYCGTGTIGLCAAKRALSITGVDIEKSSIQDAKTNAKINGIENAEFIKMDCTEYLKDNCESGSFNVVIMDPPRAGSTEGFMKALINIAPRTIIYISCNPVTLGRDLKTFLGNYDIKKVIPVDMFPHSAHVETVVLLSLKEN